MKVLHKFAAAALLAGTAVIGASAPAAAHVDVSVSIGGPGGVFVGDYDYYRPCSWYHYWGIPAPYRCYRDFYGFYGPNIYVVDGFVFRDHDDWYRWHDRDDCQHWRVHDFRRANWHDNGLHKGWYKHDHDDQGDRDWRDHDNGHGHGHDHDRDWHDHDHGDHDH